MIKIKDKVIISDPCYKRGTWCMSEQCNMLDGNYNYYVEEINTDWGDKVKSIEIVHENYKRPKKWKYKNSLIGVDTGQAGIFCEEIFPKLEEERGNYGDINTFYGKCCNLTMQNYKEIQIVLDLKESIKRNDFERSLIYYKNNQKSLESLEEYLKYHKEQFERFSKLNIFKKSFEEEEENLVKNYDEIKNTTYYIERLKIYEEYQKTGIIPETPKLIQYGIIDGRGIVSSSGFGDGIYCCYANFNKKGKCIGIKIKFI